MTTPAMPIYPDLSGRVVYISGGAQGIGAAFVAAFARQGARVFFTDVAAEAGAALADGLATEGARVVFHQADMTDQASLTASVDECVGTLGVPHVLVNNAAVDTRHVFAEVTPEFFDRTIALNVKHQFFAAQAIVPKMAAEGRGAVINMGSVSWIVGTPDLSVYTMAKSAVHGLTRNLAREYGAAGIRVNMILPGWIMTERQMTMWLTPEGEAELMRNQALKRKLAPGEVAEIGLFLASDASSAVTGQQIVADGGWV